MQHCHKIAVLRYPDGQEVVSGWTGQCQAGGVSKHSIRSRTYVHRLKTRQSVNIQGACIGVKKRFGFYHVSVYEKRERVYPPCLLLVVYPVFVFVKMISQRSRKLFPDAY